MAEYRCALTIHSRTSSKPVSAVSFYAYLARTDAVDGRTGMRVDFTNRAHELAAEGLALPSSAPEWAGDARELWKRHEAAAKRRDAQSFRQHQLMIPRDLSRTTARGMVDRYCSKLTDKGRCASWVIHVDNRGDLHAHVVETMREITSHGFGKVFREAGAFAKGKRVSGADAEDIRVTWEKICNDALETSGRSERVSRLSNFVRGLPAPTPKLSQRTYHLTKRVRKTRPGYVTQEELDKAAATAQKHAQRHLGLTAITNPEIQSAELKLTELRAALDKAQAPQPPAASPMPVGRETAIPTIPSHQEITRVPIANHTTGSSTADGAASNGNIGQRRSTASSGVPISFSSNAAIVGTTSSGTGDLLLAPVGTAIPISAPTSLPADEQHGGGQMAHGGRPAAGHSTGGHVGGGRRPEDSQDAGLVGHAGDGSFGAPRDGTSGASKGHQGHPGDRREDRPTLSSARASHPVSKPGSGDDLPGARPNTAASLLSPVALTALQVGIKLRRLSQHFAVWRAAAATPSLPTPLEPLPTLQQAWDALQSPPFSPAAVATLRVRIGLRRLGQRLVGMRAAGSAAPLPRLPLEPLPTLQQAWDSLPPLALSSAALMSFRLRAKLQQLGDRLRELRATPLRSAPTIHPLPLPTIPETLAALPPLQPVPVAALARRAHTRAAADPAWTLPSEQLQAQLAAAPLWAATATLPSVDAADPGRVLAWLSENTPRRSRLISTATEPGTPARLSPVSGEVPLVPPFVNGAAALDHGSQPELPSVPLPKLVEILANSGDPVRGDIAAILRRYLIVHPEATTMTVPATAAASAESVRAALKVVQQSVWATRAVSPLLSATSQREPSQGPSPRPRAPAAAGHTR